MEEYEKTGILSKNDLKLPNKKQLEKGVAILECVQKIPCNPCVESCPVGAISMEDINAPPVCDYDKCIACGKCVGICPGLAIFVIKTKNNGKALLTIPYEFLPVPNVDDKVDVLNREGKKLEKGTVKKIVKKGKTMVVKVEISEKFTIDARNIRL